MSSPLILENFINGEFVKCETLIDNIDPSCGEVYGKVPDSPGDVVDVAVQSAKAAFKSWSRTSPQERSKMLMKIADGIEARLGEFAAAESRDQGKPVWLATAVDIPRAVYNFRFFATAVLHQIATSTVQPQFNAVNYSTQTPIGVCGLISPWNLPLYLLSFKIAPALAAGNTVVAKPSEMTSVTAWLMCKVFQEAGLPAGVCNVVFGTGAVTGSALVTHPDVPVLSFTGGTETAAVIRRAIAPYNKKTSLELGGKNPSIVFDDADLDECVATHLRSCFANQGEICLCTSRVFVQDSIYDEFVERLVKATKLLEVGDPRKTSSKLGALISSQHRQKVLSYIEFGRRDGRVLCGEGVDPPISLPAELEKGYYVRPTVIADCPDSSPCMQDEIFGPVACISKFHSQEEAIERANGVKYGLAACVWSRDVKRVHNVARELDAGTVWTNCWMVRDLNMPFGGMKASGTGREGFKDSMEFFTESKTICIKM